MASAAIDLPNFKELLEKYGHVLNTGTRWRYQRGILPAFGEFLLDHPDLIIALAIDAERLQPRPPRPPRPPQKSRRKKAAL